MSSNPSTSASQSNKPSSPSLQGNGGQQSKTPTTQTFEQSQGEQRQSEHRQAEQHESRHGSSSTTDVAKEKIRQVAHSAADMGQDAAVHYVREPASDLYTLIRDYARDKPDVAAAWCFFFGMFVGWKLKP